MITEQTLEKYLKAILAGDRQSAREVIEQLMHTGVSAISIYMDVIWPMMLQIDTLGRAGKINSVQENLASRINRTIVDQLQSKLPHKDTADRKVVVCSEAAENNELGAQMIVDVFEAAGWDVRSLGSGLCNDDILEFVNAFAPDVLVVYGTAPQQAPAIRELIDRIRDVNAHPDMKIMLSGGVFARAEGLWEEIGADLYAENPTEAVEIASDENQTKCQPTRTINQRKIKQTVETE